MPVVASHLKLSRHGIYYARFIVPKWMRHRYPGLPKEWKASLFSSNRCVAATLARRLSLAWSYVQTVLEPPNMKDLPRTAGFTLIERPWGREVHTTPEDTPEQLAQLFAHLERTRIQVPDVLKRLLVQNVAPVSVLLVDENLVATGETERTGGVPATRDDHRSVPTAATPSGSQIWLSDAVDEWRQSRLDKLIWKTPETWTNSHGPALRVFRELIAVKQRAVSDGATPIWDIRLGDIDRSTVKRYVSAISRYPLSQGKRPSSLDAKAILAASDAVTDKAKEKAAQKEKEKPGSTAAVANAAAEERTRRIYNGKKKVRIVGGFVRWGVANNYLSDDLLAEINLGLEGPKADPDGGYRSFSDEMLKLIFSCTYYRADTFDTAWKYWTPVLGLTTAGRVREIADLTVDDIVYDEGVPCVWFRKGVIKCRDNRGVLVKRVKTVSSQRKVPIAEAVLQLGFLQYVEARRRTGQVWLWDDLIWERKSGHGRYITEWFGEFLAELGIKNGRRFTFHSFRSTWHQKIERVGLASSVVSRLMGHAPTTTKDEKYNRTSEDERGMPLALVAERINTTDWNVAFLPTKAWRGDE